MVNKSFRLKTIFLFTFLCALICVAYVALKPKPKPSTILRRNGVEWQARLSNPLICTFKFQESSQYNSAVQQALDDHVAQFNPRIRTNGKDQLARAKLVAIEIQGGNWGPKYQAILDQNRELVFVQLSDVDLSMCQSFPISRIRGLETFKAENVVLGTLPLELPDSTKYLSLRNMQLTAEQVRELGDLKQLECLALDSTNVGNDLVASLRRLPNLKILSATNTNLQSSAVWFEEGDPLRSLLIHISRKQVDSEFFTDDRHGSGIYHGERPDRLRWDVGFLRHRERRQSDPPQPVK